jgi:hypothetical protein
VLAVDDRARPILLNVGDAYARARELVVHAVNGRLVVDDEPDVKSPSSPRKIAIAGDPRFDVCV